MISALLTAPLDPSPDEARSWLRRELVRPEYNEQDLLNRLVAWLERVINGGLDAASRVPPLSTFVAMLVLLLLVLGLVWLLSRAGRSPTGAPAAGPLLSDERITAAQLRARAEAALAGDRPDDALVDGFRALAVRQIERGLLSESPGATAHEVAGDLGLAVPDLAARLQGAGVLFDLVRYGGRPATRDQAGSVLALDDDLAGVR